MFRQLMQHARQYQHNAQQTEPDALSPQPAQHIQHKHFVLVF